jgi:hypothetical protein
MGARGGGISSTARPDARTAEVGGLVAQAESPGSPPSAKDVFNRVRRSMNYLSDLFLLDRNEFDFE